MKPSPRFALALALLAAFMAALATLGGRGGWLADSDARDILPPHPAVNRIAVVGADARIRTYAPDGSDARDISPENGFYTWPAWSPDGERIAYSAIITDANGGGGNPPSIALMEYLRRADETRAIHRPPPGFAGLLANGVVHYPIWSPDSSKLAFVAVTRERGLALYLHDADSPPDAEPRFVLDDGPLWTVWSPDSSRLLIHRGSDHFAVDAQDGAARALPIRSDAYRVPAWKPPASAAPTMMARLSDARYAIRAFALTADGGLDSGETIAQVSPNAAFAWSPDGARIAISDSARPILYRGAPMLVYGSLTTLDAATLTPTARAAGNLMAYFWSPDGSKIAYVEIADARGNLRWRLLDAASGESYDLAEFMPSADQLTMFQFFDQYTLSHSLWSPDSRHLLFAGILSDTASAASLSAQNRQSRVYAVDTGPTRAVEAVADGTLGVWSWR